MRAVGDEALEPLARLRRGVSAGDADRVEAGGARRLDDRLLDFGGVAQKSRSP
jgi:hypothetical protein